MCPITIPFTFIAKIEDFGEYGCTAQIEGMPGMVAEGDTVDKAVEELKISLKVYFNYKYQIKI